MLQLPTLILYLNLCTFLTQAKVHLNSGLSQKDTSNIAAYAVRLPLDHFGNNKDTFLNRYWVNDEFWKAGGPVFLFDAGEGNAHSFLSALTYGPSNESFDVIPDLAQRFGALLILWEHRYYGESLPEQNITGLATLDDVANYYQYLTFEQALEDVAVFAKTFSLPTDPGTDVRPNKMPWVFIGGSYPGIRAAWMRLRNPEVIYASLSSSAPVEIQENFWQYWVAIERELASTPGYESCLTDMHAISQWATTVVAEKDVSTVETFLFNAIVDYNRTTNDTADAWMDRIGQLQKAFSASTGEFQYYGLDGGLGQFCNNLKSSYYTEDVTATATDLENGIFAYYGVNRSVEIYASVIYDILLQQESSGNYPDTWAGLSFKHVDGMLPDGFAVNDILSWAWQTCTEAGFFQTGDPSRVENIMPGFIDQDWWINAFCVSQFGNSVANGPNVNTSNTKYGGWHLKVSNVFFTNGEYDPWRALSVASDINPSSPNNILTTNIPAPNTVPANDTIFSYVIKNGLHTSDLTFNITAVQKNSSGLGVDTLSADKAHEMFASALSLWLPAYTPFSASLVDIAPTGTAASAPTATPTQTPTPSSAAAPGAVILPFGKGPVVALVAVALIEAFFFFLG